MRVCANCGLLIEDEKPHYSYLDNYLQAKYFDDPDGKDNIFCCEECAGKALFLTEIDQEETTMNKCYGCFGAANNDCEYCQIGGKK